jgi:hypothetical protein
MVKGSIPGLTGAATRAPTRMISNMAMECISGQTDKFIKESGPSVSNTDRACLSRIMVCSAAGSGNRENASSGWTRKNAGTSDFYF